MPSYVEVVTTISGTNGTYTFDNDCVIDDPAITYIPHTEDVFTRAAQPTTSRLQMLRLMEEDDMVLTITLREPNKADEVLGNINLTRAIMQHPAYDRQETLDRQDTYSLTIPLQYSGGTFVIGNISIEDWQIVDTEHIVW